MARGSKRQRKKNAKKMGVWEGSQNRGGRGVGKKNLIKTDAGVQNKYGVTFTHEQKIALERAVNRSNYRRKKMQAEADKLNPQNSQLRLMGKESDFIISRQSKALQQFKSMEDYEKFMGKQARIQSGEYLEERTRLYKRNYMKALDNVFGDDAKDIKMKVRMMKPEQFRKMVESNELAEINYVYDPSARTGMKLKEEDLFSELEE